MGNRRYGWTPLALAIASAVHAQTPPEDRLEEVLVTARRVEEKLQDTPIAVSAFTEQMLQERQIFNTNALEQITPNLQFRNNAPLAGNNASSQVFIRGIGQTDPTSTVDPGVGLYIDDVYMGSAVGATMDFRDIASVQVLRGPQGTLFGRNTIGGAVLLTTVAPGDEVQGKARITIGNFNLRSGFLALNVPIIDGVLKTRFSAGIRKERGYVRRSDGIDLGDTNTYTVTGRAAFTPTEAFSASLSFDYTNSDEHGTPLVFAAINEAATFVRVASADAGCPGYTFSAAPVPQTADDRCGNDLQNRGPFANNGTFPLFSRLNNAGVALNLAYDLSAAMKLKFISSYRNLDWQGSRDADNTPLTILHTTYDVDGSQSSQELQFVYEGSSLTGVAGLYYFKQQSDDIVTVYLNTPAPGIQRDSDNNIVDNHSWAAFTQWTYRPMEALGVTIGGRYTQDTKTSYPDQYDFSNPSAKQIPVRLYSDKFSDFTPSASVSYRFNAQAMTYVSYSEGFKGGGWNSHFNAILTDQQRAALHEFQPETAQTIEAGFKLDLFDNSLRLNGAVFTSDYKDMQVTYRGPASINGVAPFVTNAGKASIDGAELELAWVPASGLRIDSSVGYLDAQIDKLASVTEGIRPAELREGNRLPFAPKWQASFGASYTVHAGDYLLVRPRIDATYQSETFFDFGNTREIAQLGGYTVGNVSLAVLSQDGHWTATLGLNNATDKLYAVAGNSSLSTGSGYAEIAYARPRAYFAQFELTF